MTDDRDRIPAPPGFKPVIEPIVDANKEVVKVCHGFTCSQRKAKSLLQLLKTKLTGSDIQVVACPCTGNCRKANNVVVNRQILHGQSLERVCDNVGRELDKQRRDKRSQTAGGMSVDEADSILGL